MEYDLHSTTRVFDIVTDNLTGSGLIDIGPIDVKGFESMEFYLKSGTGTVGQWTLSLIESDDPGLSPNNLVDESLYLCSMPVWETGEDEELRRFGTIAKKRYYGIGLDLVEEEGDNIDITICVVLGNATASPTMEQL
jgi:hypothetical protein